MSKFGHLKKYDVQREKTSEYELYQLEGEPILILAPATESNKPYYNALLRGSRKKLKAVQAGKIDAATVKKNREEDRILYTKHIVKGWRNLEDAEGKEAPFNHEDVKDFLEQLPDWIFDEIRAYASNVQNFIEDIIDVEETAKN